MSSGTLSQSAFQDPVILAGGIAHEFSNVVGAVKGYIELALMVLEGMPAAEKVKGKREAAWRGPQAFREMKMAAGNFS